MNTKTNYSAREIQDADLETVSGGGLLGFLLVAGAAAAVYDAIEDRWCKGSCVDRVVEAIKD